MGKAAQALGQALRQAHRNCQAPCEVILNEPLSFPRHLAEDHPTYVTTLVTKCRRTLLHLILQHRSRTARHYDPLHWIQSRYRCVSSRTRRRSPIGFDRRLHPSCRFGSLTSRPSVRSLLEMATLVSRFVFRLIKLMVC